MLSRRQFHAGLVSSAFAGLALAGCKGSITAPATSAGYGPLVEDPRKLLDLPKGFSYRILSEFGQDMADGFTVPDRADGMGAIDLGAGKFALVRNHEMKVSDLGSNFWKGSANGPDLAYDRTNAGVALLGGTTTLVVDARSGQLETQYLSLAGTIRNCAGGVTPWGSWLSCEEDMTRGGSAIGRDHGWIFEVPGSHKGLVDPVPLKAMGRFNHEAAAVDPRTGILYLTEDRDDGLFYRFLPAAKGELAKGGKLQALGFKASSKGSDARNWKEHVMVPGKPMDAVWIDLDGTDSPDDDLRLRGHESGATFFARGEGIHYGNNEFYFACTSGGKQELGQIMRYRPSAQEGQPGEKDAPGKIDLFVESTDKSQLNYADNLTVAPNGHVIICEDQDDSLGPVDNHIRGITPQGALYPIARLRTDSELAGVCFSPDGRTMFVNVYQPGKTLAISGAWDKFAQG